MCLIFRFFGFCPFCAARNSRGLDFGDRVHFKDPPQLFPPQLLFFIKLFSFSCSLQSYGGAKTKSLSVRSSLKTRRFKKQANFPKTSVPGKLLNRHLFSLHKKIDSFVVFPRYSPSKFCDFCVFSALCGSWGLPRGVCAKTS